MNRLAQISAAAVIAMTAAACGGSNATTVTSPSGTLVTETFTGVAQVGGAQSVNNFTVTTPGSISITLVSTSPQQTLMMGLGVGNPGAGGICSFISGGTATVSASSTAALSGTLATSGAYCVAVVDVGNAASPISYIVTVAHT